MGKDCDTTFLRNHGGTEQNQRYIASLSPDSVALNDLSIADWMRFAYTFAKEVNYFNVNDHEVHANTWEAFFIEKDQIEDFVAEIDSNKKITPHLTLFISFLKLLELSNKRFNGLTARHLDFYYEKILQIDKKQAVADSAHIIFELAKNIAEAKVEESTYMEAGKDASGKRLQFTTDVESVINKASVAAIKSVYHHRKRNAKESHGLFAAAVANSVDGKGEAFRDEAQWYPFGFPAHHDPNLILDTPTLGFAVAAPVLELSEGQRNIKFEISLGSNLNSFTVAELQKIVSIYATGEKGWLGPYTVSATTSSGYGTSISGKKLQLSLEVEKDDEAITKFDSEVHGQHFDTETAVFRFLIDTKKYDVQNTGYKFYKELLKKEIKKIEVSVHVDDVESIQVQNDLGEMPADKPFFPFTTQPLQRSAFYIDYPEAFDKAWDSITVDASWLNTPSDFKQHYYAYRKDNLNSNLSPLLYYQTLYHTYDINTKTYAASPVSGSIKTPVESPSNLYVTGDDYFTAKLQIEDKETYKVVSGATELFTPAGDTFNLEFTVPNTGYETGKNGPLKLSLNQSFLHSLFPRIYALAITNDDDTLIPNEPYTPFIERIRLSYSASQSIEYGATLKTTDNVDAIQLFHEHPFGQAENEDTLVPTYCAGGELYIALENTEPLQQVSLLLQILEGTENPLAESFSEGEGISWSVLVKNVWQELTTDYLIEDGTGNFLKTGVVTVAIPSEANQDNTLLDEGYVWLRAQSKKAFDVVCKFIDIHAQVIQASFVDNNNDLSHLNTGLAAGSISKLTERDALVKKITQPYNSFGGVPEESDSAYYRRISERLRHKDRAIALWDYEHLILEEFKDIHKVKCLNHTTGDNYHSAGNVSLVVIPDIVNKNAFDIFQPRVSTAKRNEIQDYINALNSFFVTAEVINPDYEEVKVSLNVKFRSGFDENYYTREMKEDIKKYLSPWAFEETSQLNFGVTFHKSRLIAYLENLTYVDFLENVEISHKVKPTGSYKSKTNIVPSSPKAILVSAKDHEITPVKSKCSTPKATPETPCLS